MKIKKYNYNNNNVYSWPTHKTHLTRTQIPYAATFHQRFCHNDRPMYFILSF
jgi:hypothetical protein